MARSSTLALFCLVAPSPIRLRRPNQVDHRLHHLEQVYHHGVHQATDLVHHHREEVALAVVEEERMMSTFHITLVPDHDPHREGGSGHTAIQGLRREPHLGVEVRLSGAHREGGEEEAPATAPIVATAGAEVERGPLREVAEDMVGDETVAHDGEVARHVPIFQGSFEVVSIVSKRSKFRAFTSQVACVFTTREFWSSCVLRKDTLPDM